jgi:hypothetical protein
VSFFISQRFDFGSSFRPLSGLLNAAQLPPRPWAWKRNSVVFRSARSWPLEVAAQPSTNALGRDPVDSLPAARCPGPLWRFRRWSMSAFVLSLFAFCSCPFLPGRSVYVPYRLCRLGPGRPTIRALRLLAHPGELPDGGTGPPSSAASELISSPLAKKSTPPDSARCLSSETTPREAPSCFGSDSRKATSALGRG